MEPLKQRLTLIDQLLLAIEEGFESLIEFVLKDLWQFFEQALVIDDLGPGRFQLFKDGQMLLVLIVLVGHRHRSQKSRLTDLNR